MGFSLINLALSLLIKHLVIGQRQKAPNVSAFNSLLHGCLVSIGQHLITTSVVYLPKRTEKAYLPNRTVADVINELDQAVRVVHSCLIWLLAVIATMGLMLAMLTSYCPEIDTRWQYAYGISNF